MNIRYIRSSLALMASSFLLILISTASAEAPMTAVEAGELASGEKGEKKNVDAFSIDVFEVSHNEFKKFKSGHVIPDGKAAHPVTEVTYFDAEEYCKAQGKRLPTATEWEMAARGTDGRQYPWGNEFDSKKANTLESGRNGTSPIGAYKEGVSPAGAFDMSGNVWEWVDGYASSERKYRLVMGGSFFDKKRNCKAYSRLKSIPDDSHTYIGFRCAK